MNGEHLHISEIALFRSGPLSREESREAARHLLICRDCRELLPKPSRTEFLSAVFNQEDRAVEVQLVSDIRTKRFVAFVDGLQAMLRPATIVGLLLLVAAGTAVLFLSMRPAQPDADLVAVVAHSDPAGDDPTLTIPERETSPSSQPDWPVDPKPSPRLEEVKRPERTQKRQEVIRTTPQVTAPDDAGTRGSDLPCEGAASIGLETSTLDDRIRLTWGKVPTATKYSIYISDLDEKLIDRFETDNETTYVSKAEFDRDIVYKWRLIVTLKDRRTVVGPSQNFSPGTSNGNSKELKNLRPKRRSSMNIRCVGDKQ